MLTLAYKRGGLNSYLLLYASFPWNRSSHYIHSLWLMMTGIICVFVCPLLDIAIITKSLKWRHFATREMIKGLAILLGMVIVISGAGLLIGYLLLSKRFKHYLQIGIAIAISAGILYLIYEGIGLLSLFWRDRKLLKEITSLTSVDRAVIASNFIRFKTSWHRLQYVEWLRDMQIRPKGAWPAKRPYIRYDEASTLLAQLDERWLGLEV